MNLYENGTVKMKSQTEVVFSLLDPLLQKLLPLVAKYREWMEAGDSRSEPQLFSNIQSQLTLLDDIQAAFRMLGSEFAPGLLVLVDYISLPLTSILVISTPIDETATQVSPSQAEDAEATRKQVRTSHIRKLQVASANTVRAYAEVCHAATQATSDNSNRPMPSMSSKHAVSFLATLVRQIPVNLDTTVSPNSLDDGSGLWLAVLDSMQAVLQHLEPSDQGLLEAMEGQQLVLLVDAATNLILFESLDAVQLRALQFLQSLQHVAPVPEFWQASFPGVLVAVSRRVMRIHRQSSAGLSVDIESHCLHCLTLLLRGALVPLTTTSGSAATSSDPANSLLQRLQAMALKENQRFQSNLNQGDTPQPPEETNGDRFLAHLRKSAVVPISLLLRQSSVAISPRVRSDLVEVCETVLFDTLSCWNDTTIPEVALEICLILQTDTDASVQDKVNHVLQQYRLELQQSDASSSATGWMVSKILRLLQELPVLTEGGKGVETKRHLQLLIGYLQIVRGAPGIPKAIMGGSPTDFSKPLIHLMQAELSAIPKNAIVVGKSPLSQESSIRLSRVGTLENGRLARAMLAEMGKTLEIKQAGFLVDAVIADFYQTMEDKQALTLERLSEWSGSLTVAKEVLLGASTQNKVSNSQTKEERRRRRILKSLATSVLPLLADSPFWATERLEHDYSSQIRTAIGALQVLALEFMAVYFGLLKEDTEEVLPSLLPSIVDKATASNGVLVRQAAQYALLSASTACSCNSLGEFVQHRLSFLLASMLGRLRLPGGVGLRSQGETVEPLAVSASLSWALKEVLPEKGQAGHAKSSSLPSLINLVTMLMERFDEALLHKLVSEEHTFHLAHLYSTIIQHWLAAFGAEVGGNYKFQEHVSEDVPLAPWKDLLLAFKKTPQHGFGEMSTGTEEVQDEIAKTQEQRATIADVDMISKLIFRARYLLSNDSLRVRIAACESLTLGFQFLAFVSQLPSESEESANTHNAILRQVATTWPALKARLSSVSDSIQSPKTVSSLVIVTSSSSKQQDVGEQRVFLARLLALVATMSQCSGDFMGQRFVNDAWPILAKHLGLLLDKSKGTQDLLIQPMESNPYKLSRWVPKWNGTERILLISILNCLGTVIGDCGAALSILEAAGTILLPLLGDRDDEIAELAEEVIKAILAVDCDVLTRPLLRLSGNGLECPLAWNMAEGTSDPIEHKDPLSVRCRDLLFFLDTLPEVTFGSR